MDRKERVELLKKLACCGPITGNAPIYVGGYKDDEQGGRKDNNYVVRWPRIRVAQVCADTGNIIHYRDQEKKTREIGDNLTKYDDMLDVRIKEIENLPKAK